MSDDSRGTGEYRVNISFRIDFCTMHKKECDVRLCAIMLIITCTICMLLDL